MLQHVFLLYIESCRAQLGHSYSLRPLLNLTHVCQTWRNASLSFSQMWNHITLFHPKIMTLFLARSHPLPLYLVQDSLQLQTYCLQYSELTQHSHRIAHLELSMNGAQIRDILSTVWTHLPLLTTLVLDSGERGIVQNCGMTPISLPSIRHLILRSVNKNVPWSSFRNLFELELSGGAYYNDLEDIMRVIENSPRLAFLRLFELFNSDNHPTIIPQDFPINAPTLQELTLGLYPSWLPVYILRSISSVAKNPTLKTTLIHSPRDDTAKCRQLIEMVRNLWLLNQDQGLCVHAWRWRVDITIPATSSSITITPTYPYRDNSSISEAVKLLGPSYLALISTLWVDLQHMEEFRESWEVLLANAKGFQKVSLYQLSSYHASYIFRIASRDIHSSSITCPHLCEFELDLRFQEDGFEDSSEYTLVVMKIMTRLKDCMAERLGKGAYAIKHLKLVVEDSQVDIDGYEFLQVLEELKNLATNVQVSVDFEVADPLSMGNNIGLVMTRF